MAIQRAVRRLVTVPPEPTVSTPLRDLVRWGLAQRQTFLTAAHRFGTPQYLVDEALILERGRRFLRAFRRGARAVTAFYAIKCNHTPSVVEACRRSGLHADASSDLELRLALRLGFRKIVLSGPGKSDAELHLALRHREQVVIHVDSHRELARLGQLTRRTRPPVTVGLRVHLEAHHPWTKFGIPIEELGPALLTARRWPGLAVRGLQFHLSWQRAARGYLVTMDRLAATVAQVPPPAGGWRFLDIGGGFSPEDEEAVYPWLTPRGKLLRLLGLVPDAPNGEWGTRYIVPPTEPLERMADRITAAFHRRFRPLGFHELWLEPGRWIVNRAVHILLRVQDVKHPDRVITDGGTNLLGWERLEAEYCPTVNLSRPGLTPVPCHVYGSLCTPHDLWGYCYWGRPGIQEGDLLAVLAQGAYVQSLAQGFIRPRAQTILRQRSGRLVRVDRAETFRQRYRLRPR